ncbi:response regulator [Ferrigenium kumadai]|uniref:Response regulator n=1 Tax=Ferrigenium kumadai TaxID=1682490 RepID=A0AAN1SY18_9PROT|nr:response regulator [Ferrigenium kumadai]BBI99088.1 response regulator [Ferrigenium kumadai]
MKRILVVEDNLANMYLIDFIMTHAGYQVLKAETGEKAVELALQEKPDLVLMDIQLPGIDGLEATRRIRKSEGEQNITIVALTSFAMTGDKERALAAGCTGYLEKPINPETFLNDIRGYL